MRESRRKILEQRKKRKKLRKPLYGENWEQRSYRIRFVRAGGKCEWCGAVHGQLHPITGKQVFLAVSHLNQTIKDMDDSNLAALCQKCHLDHDKGANWFRRKYGIDIGNVPDLFQLERDENGPIAFPLEDKPKPKNHVSNRSNP